MKESLILAQQLDSKYKIAAWLYRWGQAAQYLGSPASSSFVLGGKTAHDVIGMGVWTQELDAEFETVLERCRAKLGDAAFVEEVEQGRAMTMEQAIACTLEDNS